MTYCKLPKLKHTICKFLNLLPETSFEVTAIFKMMTFSGISRNKYGAQWHTREFCSGRRVQQIQLTTVDRENGDLGVVAPSQGFWRQL
jgi:hypothetical protein